MTFIFVYVTYPNEKEAKKAAMGLLKKKLVGCVARFPVKSLFWWKGKITDEKEVVLLCKTLEEKFEEVKKEIEKTHPYDVPCVVKIAVDSNEKFFEWLKGEMKK